MMKVSVVGFSNLVRGDDLYRVWQITCVGYIQIGGVPYFDTKKLGTLLTVLSNIW